VAVAVVAELQMYKRGSVASKSLFMTVAVDKSCRYAV